MDEVTDDVDQLVLDSGRGVYGIPWYVPAHYHQHQPGTLAKP